MTSVAPATSFEFVTDGWPTGLVGTIGVKILDNIGGVTLARTTVGFAEIDTGVYSITLTSPAAQGQYTLVADAGGAVRTTESLDVSYTALTSVPSPTFASSAELANRLGLTFTAAETTRADALLALAAGIIQRETKQTIALVTNDVITRPGSFEDRVRLKERPVVSVASAVLNGIVLSGGTGFYLDGDELIRLNWNSESSFRGLASSGWGFPWWNLVITYTHGYATIPETVKAITMEMVARVWVNPGSVIQEAVAGTQTTYAPYSAPPRGLMLTDDEKRELNKLLGRPAGSIALR